MSRRTVFAVSLVVSASLSGGTALAATNYWRFQQDSPNYQIYSRTDIADQIWATPLGLGVGNGYVGNVGAGWTSGTWHRFGQMTDMSCFYLANNTEAVDSDELTCTYTNSK